MRLPTVIIAGDSDYLRHVFRRFLSILPDAHRRIDYTLYDKLIQQCTDRHLVRQAKQLHTRLVLSSTILDNYLASKLIGLYTKTGNLHYARQVFDEIPSKNIFSWNALLIGYSQRNLHSETINLFSSLLRSDSTTLHAKPDGFTLTCVLKAVSGLSSDSGSVRMVHCYVVKSGIDSDVFVPNGLLACYSRCDDMVSARLLFNEMPERDSVSWNSMISAYSQVGLYQESKKLYREMLDLEGIRICPNEVTALSVLQACAQSNDLVLGMDVHKYVIDNGIEMDLALCNSIITLYSKCGSLDYARDLFDDMSEKDEITYGAMISGYTAHGFIDEALMLFREMKSPVMSTWNAAISGLVQNNQHQRALDLVQEMQEFGFRPNCVTVSSILPAISHLSCLNAGKEIHGYAVRHDYDGNVYAATGLVDTYAKLGFIDGARTVFDRTKGRSVIIFTAIISAYAVQGDANVALNLFSEMLNDGLQPDPVAFTALLAACARGGLVEEAWDLFRSLVPKYCVEPIAEHYVCMVTVLSRVGRLYEALDFIQEMPIEPDAKVWGALLNGAVVSGNVEMGKFISDHMLNMDSRNPENSFLLANLYAKVGKWLVAEVLREDIKNVGLKKVAGSSWIESCGDVLNEGR